MAEEEKKPVLKEIPLHEIKSNFNYDRQIISLLNTLKDNFEAKLVTFRKELEQQTREQVSNEIIKIKDAIEQLRLQNEEVQKALSNQIITLEEKLNHITIATPENNAKLKEEVQVALAKLQALTSKFDLTLFINDIRELFEEKVILAEKRANDLAEQVKKYQEEAEHLKKALAEKDLLSTQERELPKKEVSFPYPIKTPPYNDGGMLNENQGDQTPKLVQFCKNCGKARNRTSARFCIYCGSEF